MVYNGLLGLLQTIRENHGKTGKQGWREFDQKDYGLWTEKI